MRIALAVHALPPEERTGVETHVAALARELERAGCEVDIFAPRRDPTTPAFALRREERDGFTVHWLTAPPVGRTAQEHVDPPGMARAFGEFLDRVRPEVVHFHHALRIGLGALEESVRRELPTLYTAHDYWPVCHRTVLARPDLSRCSTLGDVNACARCDGAVAYLNSLGRFRDWQAGVLDADLEPAERAELARLLSSQPTEVAERARIDERRRRVFASLDLVLAPTKFLADRLRAGGISPERIELCEYGIDSEELAKLAPPRGAGAKRLVFGFVGGASKHKGLHVLLDSFRGLADRARLVIHGDSTDRDHVARLRALARDTGAEWRGSFASPELARVLGELDVLVVPSIWWENAPFVIREAFAARRPVIASDTPALAESVRDGTDGWLVPAGDARALRATLERLIAAPELVARASSSIRPPRQLAALAGELVGLYRRVVAARLAAEISTPPPAARVLPAHVEPFARRVADFEGWTLDELTFLASEELAGLAHDSGVTNEGATGVDIAKAALDLAADARRENAWRAEREAELGTVLDAERAARRELAARLAALEAHHAGAVAELAARARQAGEAERAQSEAAGALRAEGEAHARTRAALEAARAELARVDAALTEQVRRESGLAERLATLERELTGARAEADRVARELESRGRESALRLARAEAAEEQLASASRAAAENARELAERARELAELGARHADSERQVAALRAHADWLERATGALALRFGHRAERLASEADVAAAREALAKLERELDWRRAEMRAAHADGGALWRALLGRSGLGRRMRGWDGAR